MQINKKISPYNYSENNNVKYIVIHSTGNVNDTAKNNADYFYGGNRNASAHYFVDDNQIWQVVEEYNQAWHVGDGENAYDIGNNNSIGIEMCGTDNGDISEQTINNTLELVRNLMNKYGISSDNVVRHYDASRKNCPSQFSPNNWERWKNFKNRLNGGEIMYNKPYRNALVYAQGASADKNIAECMAMYLDDSIVVDHMQYREGMGKSVYSIGVLTGIKCDVAIRGKDRRDTFEKAMSRVGFKR